MRRGCVLRWRGGKRGKLQGILNERKEFLVPAGELRGYVGEGTFCGQWPNEG